MKQVTASHNSLHVHNGIGIEPQLEEPVCKTRSMIIGKRGASFCLLKVESVAYFFVQYRVIFAVDIQNDKFRIDAPNLSSLIDILDDKLFFKANRQYIVNCKCIHRYKKYDRVKTLIEMTIPSPSEIVVGQKTSILFKKWIANL